MEIAYWRAIYFSDLKSVFFFNREPFYPEDLSVTSNSFAMRLLNRFCIEENDQCELYGAFNLQLKSKTVFSKIFDQALVERQLRDFAAAIKVGTGFFIVMKIIINYFVMFCDVE